MYVAGRLKDIHETLFETLCLFEALTRLGFSNGEAKAFVATADASAADRALLREKTQPGCRAVWVRLVAPKASTLALAFGSLPPEQEIAVVNEVEWKGCVGPCPWETAEEFERHWFDAVCAFQEAPRAEAEPLWQRSKVRAILPKLENVLRTKGFAVRS